MPILRLLPESEDTSMASFKLGDRTTSDVVVRLRTDEGRDNWFYCHSEILIEKSKYFADRLSDNWPTCQIIDSRNCVDVYCQESEFNFHVIALRLLYVSEPQTCFGVRNTLGILQVAEYLGCPHITRSCVNYLEAIPWEDADEEEILRVIPGLGSQYHDILARLQPVDPALVYGIFISTIRFATSSPPTVMQEQKATAQEQLEYMLTDDDDAPLLAIDNEVVKSEVRRCAGDLLTRFDSLIKFLVDTLLGIDLEPNKVENLNSLLSDISWLCQFLVKMDMTKDLVHYWVEASANIVRAIEIVNLNAEMLETQMKVVEVTSKVLEEISFGNVIVPTAKRLHAISVWLPFVQNTKSLMETVDSDGEDSLLVKIGCEIWKNLESAFVSIILTLPSLCQAEILAGWFQSKHVRYPDLTEAFEVWCFRSKAAKRRFPLLHGINTTLNFRFPL